MSRPTRLVHFTQITALEGDQFVQTPVVQITTIVAVPFEENAYVAQLTDRKDCLVVDPGLEPEKILRHLDSNHLVVEAILNTHGHGDHIGGNGALKRRWPQARLIIGTDDAEKLSDPELNLSAVFGFPMISPEADVLVNDGDKLSIAGFELEVLALPGHSAGHVAYLWRQHEPPIVFVGDVIFAGSVGRTDFPDGDFDQLARGIREKLFTLPDETILLSGHGPSTTVGREKRTNPFVGE